MKFTKAADEEGVFYVFTGSMDTTFLNSVDGSICPQFSVAAGSEEEARRRTQKLFDKGVYKEIMDPNLED